MTRRTAPAVVIVVLLAAAAAAATRQLAAAGVPITLPGTHRTVPQPRGSTPLPTSPNADRRDLFAPPAGAVTDIAPHAGLPALPPIPEAPGPLPAGLPLPPIPSTVPGMSSGQEAPSLPPVELAGLVLGGSPQAVLRSGSTYLIVHPGDHTPWGTVSVITPAGVVLTDGTGMAGRTVTFSHGGSPS